jgi:replicative DNA helicase
MSGGDRDPATTTIELAEQALLGALLWDPNRVRDVMEWLDPDDFFRPAHGGIYTVLVKLTRAGAAADPLTVTKVLAEGRYVDGHVNRDGSGPYGAWYLHTLLSFTPATPNPARDRGPVRFYTGPNISHHIAYARLVLEASVRRWLRGAGIRIGQHARAAVERAAAEQPAYATVAASAQRLQPVLDLIDRQLELLAARLPGAPGRSRQQPPASPPAAPIAPAVAPGHRRLTGGAASDGTDDPTAHERRRAEYWVIGGCLVSPALREMAISVLRAEDFTNPATAASWTAIATLHHRGDPIDFVLVSAQLDRQADAARLSPSDLAAFARRADYPTGCRGLATIAREALHRAVDTAHRELLTAAEDNTQSTEQVIRRAQAVLARAHTAARRLRGDTPDGPVDGIAAAHVAGTGRPAPGTAPAAGPVSSRPAAAPPGQALVKPCATSHLTPPPRRPRPHR